MLTKKQADTLRGHISHLVMISKTWGGLSATECSEEDWKCATIAHRSASDRLHKVLASMTDKTTLTTNGD